MKKTIMMMAAAVVVAALTPTLASAQQKTAAPPPSAVAMATAKQILELKGGNALYKGVVVALITRAKDTLIQANLNLSKDITDVATSLVAEFSPREQEITDQFVREYAASFTEPELKEIVAFYSSPTGRKVIETEPKVLDSNVKFLNQWAEKVSAQMIDRIRTEMKKRGKDI